jgi:hypothetical protein
VTASTALTMRSQGTVSKNFWTSRSMTQSNLQHRFWNLCSTSGSRYFATTVWATLSATVGTMASYCFLLQGPGGFGDRA